MHLHRHGIRSHSRYARLVPIMHFLYGSKKNVPRRLVGTFSSEPQLLAYVRWATLVSTGERTGKFEQGSVLASYNSWEASREPLTDDDATAVQHNPTPSML
jgi:hypothetical protein